MSSNRWAVLSVAMIAASCATPRMGQVDPVTNDVVVNSSGDDRSALPDARGLGPVANSVDHYRERLAQDPRDGQAWVGLARMQLVRREFGEAEQSARQALRIDMKNAEARKVLAETAIRRGQSDYALIVLNGIGGVESKDSAVVNMMALVALQQGRNDEARALLDRAIQINPSDIAARMNLGVLHLRYHQIAQASTQFERVLAIMPDHQDALLHMGMVNAIRGNASEAARVYDAVLSERSDNPLALYNYAVLEARTGDHDGAMAHLQRYFEVSRPTASETSNALALVDEIQRQRSARGEPISDDEIRALASRMANDTEMKGEMRTTADASAPTKSAAQPRKVAAVTPAGAEEAPAPAPAVAQAPAPAKPAAPVVAAKAAPAPVKPTAAPAKPAVPKAPVEENIEDLERELAH